MSFKNFKIFIYRGPNKYLTITFKTEPSIKFLDLLEKIKTEIEPSLKVDINCRHAICGSCAIRVNGTPILACKTSLSNFIFDNNETVELLIEPLSKNSTLGDLQTDWSDFHNSFKNISEYLVPKSEKVLYRELIDSRTSDKCIKCGICYYQCPVIKLDDEFASPAVANKQLRFIVDDRDLRQTQRLETANNNSYQCIKCFKCIDSCPKQCEPSTAISQTHTMLIKDHSTLGQIHSKALFNSIYQNGKMKESDAILKSIGFIKSMKYFPSLIDAIFQGNFAFPKKSKKLEEIKALMKLSTEETDV